MRERLRERGADVQQLLNVQWRLAESSKGREIPVVDNNIRFGGRAAAGTDRSLAASRRSVGDNSLPLVTGIVLGRQSRNLEW